MEFLALVDISYLLLIFLGVALGIVFGAIPGLTATMALAVCLPLTYSFDLNHSLAFLLALYVGGISGGLVPAILLNLPGTPSSICTTFDGYPMTRNGEGERALKVGILSSLFGGLFSLIVLYLFAPVLSDIAIKFSYIEKFLIIFFALTVIASLCQNMLVGIFSGVLGILLSLVGVYDTIKGGNGAVRLITPGMEEMLYSGFALLPVLIGMFGVGAIFAEAELGIKEETEGAKFDLLSGKKFDLSAFKGSSVNLVRSSAIGTFVGMLPGVGGSAASVLAYTQEKNFSRDSSKMGKGAAQGVIASEASNNGLTGGALIPLLSLGIPGDATTAILIGAFTLQGVQVGPLFIAENIDTWNMMVLSMFLANVVMFVTMFFAIKHIAKVVTVPKYLLYPIIIMMCVSGAYAINYGIMFDVWTLLIFGLLGYVGTKLGLEVTPLIIGFILGSSAEIYFVKSIESFGNLTVFFTKSPIAMFLWLLIGVSVVFSIYSTKRAKCREQVAV
ncbi:hypothetical protein E1162_13030 [Rhodobacteraceae bacterium RKSG542]|uniref:tripartite tricarboxylate transporter permease n=1 Tax=Pseudovibrio flavus TaxID=2529854 RepID=UPI0012BBC3AA|nr:tripartite tricarboxylate transporter permease [Pseudovibrio flavus]MTI18163.1 hypothetical protein [Pseudovibrio flavus]